MLYENPKMETLKLEGADVICSSVNVNGNHDINTPPDVSDQEGVEW